MNKKINKINKRKEQTERKMLRKILGKVKENGEFKGRHYQKLNILMEKITETMRKRRIGY